MYTPILLDPLTQDILQHFISHILQRVKGRRAGRSNTLLRVAVGTVLKLQRKKLGDKAEPNSLNLCATHRSQILAF